MLSVGGNLPFAGSDSLLIASANAAARGVAARSTVSRSSGVGGISGQGGGDDAPEGGKKAGGASDSGVKAYQKAAQKMAAGTAATASGSTDSQTTAEINRLKAADAAVRAHEAAHVVAGGSLVRGGATFTYQQGPDGKQYAVGGEVSIDVSAVPGNPQATIAKMETVRAAALAPSDPSATDRAVAAQAAQLQAAARAELAEAQTTAGAAGASGGSGEAPDNTAPDSDEVGAAAADYAQAQAAYTAAMQPQTGSVFQAAA